MTRSFPPMPVIVGVPRSGTTLLRFMIDSHSQVAIPPETGWLIEVRPDDPLDVVLARILHSPQWPDFHLSREALAESFRALHPFTAPDGVREFYRLYAARFGKPRWGEKTPVYGPYLEALERLLPEAHFLHIVRDGRDVAVSVRGLWFAPGDSVEALAQDWRDRILATRAQGARCRRYREVRYERLVQDPESVLREVCGELALAFEPGMLEYHLRAPQRLAEHEERLAPDGRILVSKEERLRNQRFTTQPPEVSRIARWRKELTSNEVRRFERIAGDLLRELGY